MSISTKLFAEQTLSSMSRLDGKITSLQDQVASGRKDVRPSQDVTAAVKLNAAKELMADTARYRDNLTAANERMLAADGALASVSNIMIRAKEIMLQGANDTLTPLDRQALAIEIDLLKEALVGLANTRDGSNQTVFGGYQTRQAPFILGEDGSVSYAGDTGQTAVRVGPNDMLVNAINGQDLYMRVPTQNGPKSAFAVLDEAATILQRQHLSKDEVTINSSGGAILSFDTPRAPLNHSFTISGPNGVAEISVDIVSGIGDPMKDAINAVSDITGVVATLSGNAGDIHIASTDGSKIKLTSYQVEGQDGVAQKDGLGMIVKETSATQEPLENIPAVRFVDKDHSFEGALDGLRAAVDHVALNHSKLGAYMGQARRQDEILASRELTLQKSRSEIEDADLADLVTKIQSMMVNRDATRQLFSKTISQSLFDFMR